MPYYICENEKCKQFNKEMFVDKVKLYYDSKMNLVDSGLKCPNCKKDRKPIDTPMPEGLIFRGVMKYK